MLKLILVISHKWTKIGLGSLEGGGGGIFQHGSKERKVIPQLLNLPVAVAQEAAQTMNTDGGQAKNNLPCLCSYFLSVETTNLMPQVNNMLQYSLVCFSCLSIQVKWTTAASFDQNSMKQLKNISEKSGLFFNADLGSAYIFFYTIPYHTIPSILNLVQ